MSRLAVVFTALIVLASPAIAAKDKLEPRAQAMLACASVNADEDRLRCYDQSILALQQALGKGDVVLKENKSPKTLEGVVRASGSMGDNRYWIEFESGDRWHLTPSIIRNEAPRVGSTLKLRKGFASNYWISGPGWPTSPARHVSRP